MSTEWLNTDVLKKQEARITSETERVYGKARYGFSRFALDGIDLLLHGIHNLRNVDDSLDATGEFKNYEMAIRTRLYYNLYHVSLTYKAVYNLIHQGYYTEAAILLRQILETLVTLKYLHKQKDMDLLNTSWAGHYGYKGKKSKIKFITMFDSVAPGLYHHYRLLCDMAHGAFAAHLLKIRKRDYRNRTITLDDGLVFKQQEASYVVNQFVVYLYVHLKLMIVVFPEIPDHMPRSCAMKYHRAMSKLDKVMEVFAASDGSMDWYATVRQLWDA